MEEAAARMAAEVAASVGRERALEEAYRKQQQCVAREALTDADRMGWVLAASVGEFSALRAERLAAMQVQRDLLHAEAMRRYTASRLKTQQVLEAVKRSRTLAVLEEERRAQAAGDDRYASRLEWMRTQARMKAR